MRRRCGVVWMTLATIVLAGCVKHGEERTARESTAVRVQDERTSGDETGSKDGPTSADESSRPASPEANSPAADGTVSVDAPGVVDVQLGLKVEHGEHIDRPMDTFSPGDTIIAAVHTHGSPAGSRVVARWVYTEAGSELVVAEDERTLTESDPTTVRFDMANRDQWRPGRYELRVSVNGALQETRLFQVRD